MEPSKEPSRISKDNFLEVPSLSYSFSEDEAEATFKPGFSPQPTRRGSDPFEDMYLDTPSSGTRRVSFADTFGLNLVSVKEFDSWEFPSAGTNFDFKKDIFHTEEYVLLPQFDLPSSKEDLMQQLQEQKAILESTEYFPGSTCMKGIIRVQNVSFEKLVYVRMSLDDWQTHYDILAEYVPNSCDGETDQFSFKIALVPPYQKEGNKIEFCIRYETSVGTFWSNNKGKNYTLVCQKKEQELESMKPQEEVPNRQIKGCLKVKPSKEESPVTSDKNKFENSNITDTSIPAIVCSHEDKEDLESSNQNVKDVNREHDEHNEKELELMINQHLIRTRRTASRDKKDSFSTGSVHFPNKAEELEKKNIYKETCTDLFKRPLSPNSSVENSLNRGLYHKENECDHQPSEEITPNLEEIKQLLENDTSGNEYVRLHTNGRDILDDNANLAQGMGSMQRYFLSSKQPMADDVNEKQEGEAKTIEGKDWECLRREFHLKDSTGKGSSEKVYSKSEEEEGEGQRAYLVINEKSNTSFQDQDRMTGHSEISMKGIGASNQDLDTLPRKDTISGHKIAEDMFSSLRTNLSWKDTVLTSPESDLLSFKGTPLGETADQVWSPRNGNVLRNDDLSQIGKEKSDWFNPEDQKENKQPKHSCNVVESQGQTKMRKTSRTEQIKELADCQDMWEKRDTTRSLKATPTEELFTCQETAICELSSLADHGVTEEAEAGTAYIIKTTSETALESMSAREKAIIAKLPQETAQSDRPMEVEGTVFDPHEERNDNSHDTLCQRDTEGVIYDNDFKKQSCLGICKVHVDEIGTEETKSRCPPGKIYDVKKCGIGSKTFVEESLQVITENQKAASELDFHLRMLPKVKKTFLENEDQEQVQELPKKTETVIHSAFKSDSNRSSANDSYISNSHSKMSVSSDKQAIEIENNISPMTPQSISMKSEYNCDPTNAVQHTEKSYPDTKQGDMSKNSEIETAGNRKESCEGQIRQQGDYGMEQSPGSKISISGTFENMGKAKHENEGLINSEQSLGDKESECSLSTSLFAQESQADSSKSLLSRYMHSKISYFLLFLIFLATIYHYDLMIGLAFYLFSLYWLSWAGGRQKETVKKK
ncbi:protein phosphatase 1 regulatory subunit 3A [Sorex araneus]|uniref:protein phosphatase 1 regulatory subunit 3A n=1 Tax=Sorex araneus TaxID=42254 RepID=UPI002433F096|nr:protein phosphatase 1 regulatory subunit 3A [Sorex araneus]